MPVRELITSAQNAKIKELLALQEKSHTRRERGLFVVEGRRELERCLGAGFRARCVFVCPEIAGFDGEAVRRLSPQTVSLSLDPTLKGPPSKAEGGNGLPGTPSDRPAVFEISRQVYEKIAYRRGTEGIIAEIEWRQKKLEDLLQNTAKMTEVPILNPGPPAKYGKNDGGHGDISTEPLIMVLESVEKPGNLGAVLRSADAAGADAVIICDPLTDIYNPNVIRASVGAVFTVPTVCCSSEEAIAWLKAQGIQILTAQLQDSSLYYDRDMTLPTAIVMGTESTGLTDIWRKAADAHIRIPMLGVEDSLNVSVSASILLYEAVRQRLR